MSTSTAPLAHPDTGIGCETVPSVSRFGFSQSDLEKKAVALVILPTERDPRLITVRRRGTLLDADHHLLALWAADCAEHVLHHFERVRPDDQRPRQAIAATHAWVRGEMRMSDARMVAFASNAAGNDICWGVFTC